LPEYLRSTMTHTGLQQELKRKLPSPNLSLKCLQLALRHALFARGQAENPIKLHKSQLASDRTSCRTAPANQVRLVLHTATAHADGAGRHPKIAPVGDRASRVVPGYRAQLPARRTVTQEAVAPALIRARQTHAQFTNPAPNSRYNRRQAGLASFAQESASVNALNKSAREGQTFPRSLLPGAAPLRHLASCCECANCECWSPRR
jgi:hypothetical protein